MAGQVTNLVLWADNEYVAPPDICKKSSYLEERLSAVARRRGLVVAVLICPLVTRREGAYPIVH